MYKPICILALLVMSTNMFAQNVGIGTNSPKSKLDVAGKLTISNDSENPVAGTMRYHSGNKVFEGFNGNKYLRFDNLWSISGNNVYRTVGSPVLIGRTTTIGGSEAFGVRYSSVTPSYGGMYIEVNGNAGGKPFYGYAIDNSGKMWHYYDGATGSWHLHNLGIRMSVQNNGDVGIGTDEPDNRLDISSDGVVDTTETVLGLISNISNRPVLQFSEWAIATPTSGMSIEYDGVGAGSNNKLHIRGVDVKRKFTYTSGGRMGIGVESPNEMVEIAGTGRVFIGDGAGSDRSGLLIDAVEGGNYVRFHPYDYSTNQNMDLVLSTDVVIGSVTPATGYKLSVDGKIMTEELKVQLSQNWPDYVFEEGYELLSPKGIATYIKANGHLPGIPSAGEIEDQNGFHVGEMNRLLLVKIEELTLLIIRQDRRIDQLETQLND